MIIFAKQPAQNSSFKDASSNLSHAIKLHCLKPKCLKFSLLPISSTTLSEIFTHSDKGSQTDVSFLSCSFETGAATFSNANEASHMWQCNANACIYTSVLWPVLLHSPRMSSTQITVESTAKSIKYETSLLQIQFWSSCFEIISMVDMLIGY